MRLTLSLSNQRARFCPMRRRTKLIAAIALCWCDAWLELVRDAFLGFAQFASFAARASEASK